MSTVRLGDGEGGAPSGDDNGAWWSLVGSTGTGQVVLEFGVALGLGVGDVISLATSGSSGRDEIGA
jgi:hypothetical protein